MPKTLGHVAALLAALVVLGVSLYWLQQVLGPRSPWLWLLVMLNFTGLAKIAEPLFTLPLPRRLRGVGEWEMTGRLYRQLGVPRFGALLRHTPLRYLNTSVYVAHAGRDLALLRRQVASAEAIHVWALLLFMPVVVWLLWRGEWAFGITFVLIQILFNLYPVLHLRMLRGRLDRFFARRHAAPPRSTR